ncbi:RHS repeat-associated core domain-containing protein [Kaistella anthropi]|nr:RHS repeat-associated core domain-containing protein [Kaistella anthropi]
MTGLNLDSSGNFQTGKLFNYKINYNNTLEGLANPNPDFSTAIKPRYNGNIAEVLWQKYGDTHINRYGYVYDGLNRLLAGLYQSDLTATSKEHSERLTYDLNGNIITLKRSAFFMGTAADLIDNLEYDYTGNRLDAVHDNRGVIPNPSGYEGGGNTISYDVNGNMVDMRDKGITAISYNHLNLPKQFTINPDSNTTTLIKTIYRADGLKIRKENTTAIGGIIGDLTTVSATDYLDGFQYLKLTRLSEGGGSTGRRVEELETEVAMEREAFSPELMAIAAPPVINANQSAVLQFVPTAEGFYDFTENKYIYQYKDHLGNTRLSYAWNSTTSSIDVLDRNDYYPFGMNHLNLNARSYVGQGSYKNYKYNGKELQETGMYDYGARFYMADIGRWGVVDPLAEQTPSWSPYAYGFNNPIRFIDPTGMSNQDWVHNRQTNQIYWNENATSQATAGANETYLGTSGTYTTESGSTTALNSDGSHTNNSLLGGLGIMNNLDPLIHAGDAAPAMSYAAFGDPNAATVRETPSLNTIEGAFANPSAQLASTTFTAMQQAPFVIAPEIAIAKFAKYFSATSKVANGSFYSVAYEAKISSSLYPWRKLLFSF